MATNKISSLAGDRFAIEKLAFTPILVPISDRQIFNTVAKGSVASNSIFAQKNVTAEQVAVPIEII